MQNEAKRDEMKEKNVGEKMAINSNKCKKIIHNVHMHNGTVYTQCVHCTVHKGHQLSDDISDLSLQSSLHSCVLGSVNIVHRNDEFYI